VTILYEDQAVGGNVRDFGPHIFVTQLVCDRLGIRNLRDQLHGVPKKGASNLRIECRCERPRFGRDGRHVFAVYDDDQVRALVKLPPSACKHEVKNILRAECPLGDRLIIVLLERNIESVVEGICECDPAIVPREVQDRALRHKRMIDRDIVLKNAAMPTPERRRLRERVLEKVPSLAYLIDKVVAACAR
jgi:hypothetical protein